jgi:hypothetical protein
VAGESEWWDGQMIFEVRRVKKRRVLRKGVPSTVRQLLGVALGEPLIGFRYDSERPTGQRFHGAAANPHRRSSGPNAVFSRIWLWLVLASNSQE